MNTSMKTIAIGKLGSRPWLGQVRMGSGRQAVRQAGRRRSLGDATPLSDATFAQALSAPAAVVDFWSPTCIPCVQSKPAFDEVASSPPGNVFMGTVNADEAPETVAKYNVEGLPTQIYFVNGSEVGRSQGAFTKDSLLADMASKLPAAAPAGPATEPNRPPPSVQPPPSQIVIFPPPGGGPVAIPVPAPAPAAAPAVPPDQISTPVLVVGAIAVAALAVGLTLLAKK